MTDSLLLGAVELNSGPYWIGTGYDLGSGQVETVALSQQLVDGEVVTGRRTGNRTISLPVLILTASAAAARAAMRTLAQLVDQRSFTLTWTPANGLPVVFDCFRGQTTQEWSILEANQGVIRATLTMPALPFTRDVTAQTAGTAIGPTASLQIDAYDNTTGLTIQTGATAGAQTGRMEGTAAVYENVPFSVDTSSGRTFTDSGGNTLYPVSPYTWLWSRSVTLDMTGFNSAIVNYLTDYNIDAGYWRLRLVSSGGYKEWKGSEIRKPGTWSQVVFNLLNTPAVTSGTFNPAAVTSYILTSTNTTGWSASGGTSTQVVDDLRAYPSLSGTITSPSTALRLDGIAGDYRTPATLIISANQAFRTLLLSRSPNPATAFTGLLRPTSVTGSVSGAFGSDATALVTSATYTTSAGANNGTYTIALRAAVPSGTSVTFTATASIAGSAFTQAVSRTFTTAGGEYSTSASFALFVLGELTLPPVAVAAANSGAVVTITVTSSVNAQQDELYLLDISGDTLLVRSPTAYKVWAIVPPDPAGFGSQVLAGQLADMSDAVSLGPYVQGQGVFNLDPGSTGLLTVLDPYSQTSASGTLVTSATLTASYYPRYFGGR